MPTRAKDNSEKATTAEWLSFWDTIGQPDRITIIIGFLILLFLVLLLGYFGTRSISRSLEYYRMSFSAEFIEDIRPGTKVRYQGALEIGEVEYLSSDLSGHKIVAKIRNDFPIPKSGSRASLSSWGYFGAKFINIEIVPSVLSENNYSLEQSMPLEKIVNSTIMFQQYYDAIRRDGGQLSLLENRLQQLKKTVSTLRALPYAQKHSARLAIRSSTAMMNNFFSIINSTSSDLYNMLLRLNNVSEYMTYDLNNQLPVIKARITKLEQSIAYESQSFSARLLHDETIYDLILDYTRFANEKLNDMESAPYTIFFSK